MTDNGHRVHEFDTKMDNFSCFRENTIGYDQVFPTPYGEKKMVYADWTASGRLFDPIETLIRERFGPFVGNTHSESSVTGRMMTDSYRLAAKFIKQYVGANDEDVLISCGTGSTGAINKLQRILGLRVYEKVRPYMNIPDQERPVVFLTHMEHHSNHTSWMETIADVVCLPPNDMGLVEPNTLREALLAYKNRKVKIGSFTACSNVTGIMTPYHELSKIMHEYNGWCFVDFAASAPYVPIHMHPSDESAALDAIFLSPHKFLGGPGSSGLLVFNRKIYQNHVPDHPGGGTVKWTNPWGGREYFDDIELREDGGTPGFLQLIRAALAFNLKERLLNSSMEEREANLVTYFMKHLEHIRDIRILAGHIKERLGVFSFYLEHLHYNLVVRLLNDRFGIQARGGCSCAGTYGHFLMNIDRNISKSITDKIDQKDLSGKPGWVRISLHPIMTDAEAQFILYAIEEIAKHGQEWALDYDYNPLTNEFINKNEIKVDVSSLFQF
jgi:selenocysteine lyase/cysteine desulfurase